jgi:predicted RecB family nuclease
MLPSWEILHAMLHCEYKAWQLAKNQGNDNSQGNTLALDNPIELPISSITAREKLALTAFYKIRYNSNANNPSKAFSILLADGKAMTVKLGLNSIKVDNLIAETLTTIQQDSPPAFYKNKHCPECQYWNSCYRQLQERNCISLLSGMSPKVILRFHKRGIFSINQLSCLFRPRRRRRQPKVSSNYLWELKALAITEKRTFVLHEPEIKETEVSLYFDFEGLPEEGWIYLIGLVVSERGQSDKTYSFWATGSDSEKEIFARLFAVLNQFPDAAIFHYGSYEIKELKRIQKKWPEFRDDIAGIQIRMVNLLGFLRNNV